LYKARHNAFKAVNFFMVEAYWNIGKRIVDEEQKSEKHENKLRSLIKPITSNCIQLMNIIGKITISKKDVITDETMRQIYKHDLTYSTLCK
jgi:hypothetical protein